MKTDGELEQALLSELRWTPELDITDIALKVHRGVVTLTGFARAYRDKMTIEEAAKKIVGIRGVANEIQVRGALENDPSDPQIAREAVATLARILPGLRDSLKVVVKQGYLTLEGTAPLYFQREQAQSILSRLPGVKGITNAIGVMPHAAVTLSGRVRSWSEREQAQQTAWAAPGVTEVENDIVVSP